MIRPELLQEFISVVGHRSISEAASKLSMPSQTLNRHIEEIEDKIGHAVLYRENPLRLTVFGQTLYQEAIKILGSYDELERTIRSMEESVSGRLRIHVCNPPMYIELLYNLIEKMRNSYPGVSIEIIETLSEGPVEAVKREVVDFAPFICFGEPSAYDSDIFYSPISCTQSAIQFCFAKTHRLARKTSLTLDDLASERILIPSFERNGILPSALIAFFERIGLKPSIEYADSVNFIEFHLKVRDDVLYPFFDGYLEVMPVSTAFRDNIIVRELLESQDACFHYLISLRKPANPAVPVLLETLNLL